MNEWMTDQNTEIISEWMKWWISEFIIRVIVSEWNNAWIIGWSEHWINKRILDELMNE